MAHPDLSPALDPTATSTPVDPLDNPIWHALRGAHLDRSEVAGPGAARYDPAVSVFAALEDRPGAPAWAGLADLVGPDGVAVLIRAEALSVPDGWARLAGGVARQMTGERVEGRVDPDVAVLGADDGAEALELVGLAQPGRFTARTIELGRYVGLRRQGRLVALAGERFALDGWVEVSAVCTHPDHRGQGLARRVVLDVVAAIQARGARPLLHVADENTAAQALYRDLGFELRRPLEVTVARAPGGPDPDPDLDPDAPR